MTRKPTATLSKLTFSGGQSFSLKPGDKIILVGPNNSGKTQSLREISSIIKTHEKQNSLVIQDLEIEKIGNKEELKYFIESQSDFLQDIYSYRGCLIHKPHIDMWDTNYLYDTLSNAFVKNVNANDRLKICEQQNSISPTERKSKPQHVLYDDQVLMEKISRLFRQAFGEDLMFDFRGGSKLPIHVGQKPKFEGPVDRVSNEYTVKLRERPLLDQQGDGMKSYAGILFETVVVDFDITMIDEPEAFLHPPQMRRLGETLAQEVKGQLLVATHSSDIMRGFLEGTRGNVRILRIRREDSVNMVTEAAPNIILELWKKPVLRYSNALEGIFHEQAIICEDDSDCRLVNSVADYLDAASDDQWQDTAYVPAGGKHSVPKIAGVLRETGVPVKAIFDIDFLSEKSLVKTTFEAFGGTWNEIKTLWQRVDAEVRQGVKPKTVAEIRQEIIALLQNGDNDNIPRGRINDMMKQDKPWNVVKKFGTAAIPHGDAQRHFGKLNDALEKVGIFLVPVGEIENFCPEIGKHGPSFVTSFLSNKSLGGNDLEQLRSFVTKVHKGPTEN